MSFQEANQRETQKIGTSNSKQTLCVCGLFNTRLMLRFVQQQCNVSRETAERNVLPFTSYDRMKWFHLPTLNAHKMPNDLILKKKAKKKTKKPGRHVKVFFISLRQMNCLFFCYSNEINVSFCLPFSQTLEYNFFKSLSEREKIKRETFNGTSKCVVVISLVFSKRSLQISTKPISRFVMLQ